MKSVLISIQPYYVFLIIARLMGWDIVQEKTLEVRKDFPKAPSWNKITNIYCSKNRKSFNRIPVQYQSLMEKLLGKVIGEFVCDKIYDITTPKDYFSEYLFFAHHGNSPEESQDLDANKLLEETCLSMQDMIDYASGKTLYGWRISDLKIYDTPKELREFRGLCKYEDRDCCACPYYDYDKMDCAGRTIKRPPQSWFYVEEFHNRKLCDEMGRA